MRPAAPAKKHGSAKRAKNNAGQFNSFSAQAASAAAALPLPPPLAADTKIPALSPSDMDAHVAQAWEWWNSIGAPKYHVAPMVDQVRIVGVVGGVFFSLSLSLFPTTAA